MTIRAVRLALTALHSQVKIGSGIGSQVPPPGCSPDRVVVLQKSGVPKIATSNAAEAAAPARAPFTTVQKAFKRPGCGEPMSVQKDHYVCLPCKRRLPIPALTTSIVAVPKKAALKIPQPHHRLAEVQHSALMKRKLRLHAGRCSSTGDGKVTFQHNRMSQNHVRKNKMSNFILYYGKEDKFHYDSDLKDFSQLNPKTETKREDDSDNWGQWGNWNEQEQAAEGNAQEGHSQPMNPIMPGFS